MNANVLSEGGGMTEQEALEKAKKWWGPDAYVEDCGPVAERESRYMIGYYKPASKYAPGQGASWEEAVEMVESPGGEE